MAGFPVCYFFVVWLVAALAGCSRCVYDDDFRTCTHLLSVACLSGFIGFSVVAISIGDLARADFNPAYYLGVSTAVGLAGKEQTQIITAVWQFLVGRLSVK